MDVKDTDLRSDFVEFVEISKKTGIINSPRSWSVALFKKDGLFLRFSRGGSAKKFLAENFQKDEKVRIYWFNSCGYFAISSIHDCEYLLSVGSMDIDDAINNYREERRTFFVFLWSAVGVYILFLVMILIINRLVNNNLS
ncbi:hypothetical protein [Neptuniibacter sp. CAU 1671]|uniref:hypothetical protein n=1 Tax=Neptuniibacter sp. CAU 1671 TaxID=3032593 RepID=UPI0023DC2165|nr:hypothetical protein [Neptuniibacter sp. CAU 1671]MDF2180633.1 hypothetical protein [Neptuniibacter sp. CAU 1671]